MPTCATPKAGARFTGDEADIGMVGWIDATLFNFMIDRAATSSSANNQGQLPAAGPGEPGDRQGRGRTQELRRGLPGGDVQGRATRAEIQRRFKKWFVAAMRIFGRPGTAGNRYCIEVGLKTRDSGDVAAAYLDSIRPVMAVCGLHFPARDELGVELARRSISWPPSPARPPRPSPGACAERRGKRQRWHNGSDSRLSASKIRVC